jgi:hypothetical protein
MSTISQRIQNLTGGVTQMPDSQKQPGQLRECINFIPDATRGLTKRPGFEFINTLAGATVDGSWFDLKYDEEDQYVAQLARNGTLRIWDRDAGVQQTVNNNAGSYGAHTSQADVELLQVGDFVFVLNRTRRVVKAPDLTPAQREFAFIVINSVSYDTEYTVTLNDVNYTYTSPNDGVLSIDNIRSALLTLIPGSTWGRAGRSNVIIIESLNQAPFRFSASGGLQGDALFGSRGTVQSIAELPRQFPQGRIVQVKAPGTEGDGYWVRFETDEGEDWFGIGKWVETTAPTEQFALNIATMPHVVVKEADGSFTYRDYSQGLGTAQVKTATQSGVVTSAVPSGTILGKYYVGQSFPVYGGSGINLRLRVQSVNSQGRVTAVSIARPGRNYSIGPVTARNGDTFQVTGIESREFTAPAFASNWWKSRAVGSEESVPFPSFVDNFITGLSFFQNRLVFMSADNAVCSVAGDPVNFFALSAAQVLDSDPIDLNAGALRSLEFRYGIQSSNRLLLVSESAQYSMGAEDSSFSPATAELSFDSNIRASRLVPPVQHRGSMLIVEEDSSSARVYRMVPEGRNQTNRLTPVDMTLVVPSYLGSNVFKMSYGDESEMLAIASRQDPTEITFFKSVTRLDDVLQQAWYKWSVSLNVDHIQVYRDKIYVVGRRNNQTILAQGRFSTSQNDGLIEFQGDSYVPRLDLRVDNPLVSYNETLDITTINLSGTIFASSVEPVGVFVTGGDGKGDYHEAVPSGQSLQISGPLRSTDISIGFPYVASAELGDIFVRQGESSEADTVNIPVVHRLRVRSNSSGPFLVEVGREDRDGYTHVAAIKTPLNYPSDTLGMYRAAETVVPVFGRGDLIDITIKADGPLPATINEITWQGTVSNRGIR